jgi:hypothetical protein
MQNSLEKTIKHACRKRSEKTIRGPSAVEACMQNPDREIDRDLPRTEHFTLIGMQTASENIIDWPHAQLQATDLNTELLNDQ